MSGSKGKEKGKGKQSSWGSGSGNVGQARGTGSGKGGDGQKRGGGGGGKGANPRPYQQSAQVQTRGGRSGKVFVNYFPLKFPEDLVVYHYDVSILNVPNASKLPRALSRQMVNTALASLENASFLLYFAYDGVKSIYTFGPGYEKLGREKTVAASLQEGERSTDFSVRFRQVATLEARQLNSFVNGVSLDFPQDIINVFDILLQQYPLSMSNFVSTRSSVFINITRGFGELKGGMVLYKGMRSSIRPGSGQAFVNIDTAAAVFFSTGNVLDIGDKFLRDFARGAPSLNTLKQPLGQRERTALETHLKGLLSHVTHRPSSRPYRIKKLSDKPAGQITFSVEETQKQVCIVDYFFEQWKIRINKHLPCIVSGSNTRPIMLPLEICQIVEKQPYPISRLRDEHVAEMIKYTRETPMDRKSSIQTNRDILVDDNPFLDKWGVGVSKEMVLVNACIIPPPAIRYSNPNRTVAPSNGVWRFDEEKFAGAKPLGGNYGVIVLANERQFDQQSVTALCQDFTKQGQKHGLNVGNAAVVKRLNPNLRLNDVRQTLLDVLNQPLMEKRIKLQLLLIVLSDASMELYKEIKYYATTDLGIATQCVNGPKVRSQKGNRAMQYWSNVFLKINPKLGGRILDLRFPTIVQDSDMFVGVDVSHGTTRPTEPSVAVAVANIDKEKGRYPAALRLFTGDRSNRELITVFGGMMIELLQMYQANNGSALPKRIFIFRDGVSEGQFADTKRVELDSLRKALHDTFGPNYKPKLVLIICSKRHRTRIFPETESIRDRNGNVAAGTLVNTVVTFPEKCKITPLTSILHNFILASHASIIGTTRPTRYYVLEDEIGMTSGQYEDLTHALCYSYARCARAVSLPAPAYYADLCAEKAWAFVRTKPDGATALRPVAKSLQQTMWYL